MDRFIDEKEAARISGMSRYWFQKRRCTGGGPPYIKINGHAVRYPLKELVDWINGQGLRKHTSQHNPEPRQSQKTGKTTLLRRIVNGAERVQLIET